MSRSKCCNHEYDSDILGGSLLPTYLKKLEGEKGEKKRDEKKNK